jgi:hypothetical protein
VVTVVQSKGTELEGTLGTVVEMEGTVGTLSSTVEGTVGTLSSTVEGTVGTPPSMLVEVGEAVEETEVEEVVASVVEEADVVVGAAELDVTIAGGPQTGATLAAANSITVIE